MNLRFQLRYLDGVLYGVVSGQLAELRVAPVIDTQVQVFVEDPEVFVGPLHQPVSPLTQDTTAMALRAMNKSTTRTTVRPVFERYLTCNLDQEEQLFGVQSNFGSFTLSLCKGQLQWERRGRAETEAIRLRGLVM